MFTETANSVQVAAEESTSGEWIEADVATTQAALVETVVAWLRQLKVSSGARA